MSIRTSLPTQPRVVANAQSIIECDTLHPIDELRPDHPASNDRGRYDVHYKPDSRRRSSEYAVPRTVRSERYPTRYVIAGQRCSSCCDPNRIQSRFTQHAFVTAGPVKTARSLKVATNRENKNENDVDCCCHHIAGLQCNRRFRTSPAAFWPVPVRSELPRAGPGFRHSERLGSQPRQ